MSQQVLIQDLFKAGLGEYLVLHITDNKAILGKIVYEKGRMLLRDNGLLADLNPEVLQPCWDTGLIGMICHPKNKDWESLTFYGLDNCNLKVDLESTRHGNLKAAQNQYKENLIDFVGSIYRGFNLMLENNFLPVLLLQQVKSKAGENGLKVTDLRAAPMSIVIFPRISGHQVKNDNLNSRRCSNGKETK